METKKQAISGEKMKIQKSLWVDTMSSEIIAKQFGSNLRIMAVFSKEELLKHSSENFKAMIYNETIIPIPGTTVWVEGPELEAE